MRDYELTYLVSDDVLEADLKKVTDKVASFITGNGGKITKEESWGRRKLAYPIEKQNFATYITVWFKMEANKLAELDHEIRVYSQIIRHLTTLKVEKNEAIKVSKSDIVDTEEVEKVIGEKSFEVVEGETEASKDLMAVREKDGDQEVTESENTELDEKIAEKPKTEKITTKTKKAEKKVKIESKEEEADRMKKLDEKLDELLGDDL